MHASNDIHSLSIVHVYCVQVHVFVTGNDIHDVKVHVMLLVTIFIMYKYMLLIIIS